MLLQRILMAASFAAIGSMAAPLATGSLVDLATTYAPQIVFHPDEKYFSTSVDYMFQHWTLKINGQTVANQPTPLSYSNLGYLRSIGTDDSNAYLTVAGNVIADDTLPPETQFLQGPNPATANAPIYAFIVPKPNNVVDIYYWAFSPYNLGKSSPLGRVDDHVADWEHFMVRTVNGQAVSVSYYTHSTGTGVGTVSVNDPSVKWVGTHPVSYSALGSHGMWPQPGSNVYKTVLGLYKLTDDTGDGVQWNTWNNVYPINYQYGGGYTGDLSWLNYNGHYGNPGDYSCWFAKAVGSCELADGPPGPNRDMRGPPRKLFYFTSSLFVYNIVLTLLRQNVPPAHVLATFNSDPDHSVYNFQIDAGVAAAAAAKGYTYVAVHQHCYASSSGDDTDNWGFVPFQGTGNLNYSVTTDRCKKDRSRHVGTYGIAFCTAASESTCPSASDMRAVKTYNGNTVGDTKAALLTDLDIWWVGI
ncbi:Vacuolar protein sorting-associated protein 62 [Blyttiomyces sp. JEL0837]|nr:Vacuolar protein sorting-associated protein 62 [Blyttiomyces sp. JEL0837]